MKEKVEIIDGNRAYNIAMENLRSTWNNSNILLSEFPNRYFNYGEKGRGLVLPYGLVYISSESAEDIRKMVSEKIEIGPDLNLIDFNETDLCSISGKIPEKAIAEIITFTEEIKERINIYKEIHQRHSYLH